MKKILITIAIAIVSIVITITTFNVIGANASDIQPHDPKVVAKLAAQSYETKLKNGADYLGISVKEAEAYIAMMKPSCRMNYDLLNNRELDDEMKQACSDMESIKMFDK